MTLTAPTSREPLTAGTRVVVIDGCQALSIRKGSSYTVDTITPLGPEYSHAVQVRLVRVSGLGPNAVWLYAQHINRLSDPATHLNSGNPFHRITVRRA